MRAGGLVATVALLLVLVLIDVAPAGARDLRGAMLRRTPTYGIPARSQNVRALVGAGGPPPLGAAGPPPLGAAGPPPLGAAGPLPLTTTGAVFAPDPPSSLHRHRQHAARPCCRDDPGAPVDGEGAARRPSGAESDPLD